MNAPIIGKHASVNKPDANTHLMKCIINNYDKPSGKYEVHFEGSWVGYYSRRELTINTCP